MLFEKLARKDQSPKRRSEPLFVFLNRSPRRDFIEIRRLLKLWYSRYPRVHQEVLKARFCSEDNSSHISAFFELWMHETLLCMNYQVEIHPDVKGVRTHPEFLARKDGTPLFYIECALAEGSKDEAAARKREDVVYDTLDGTDSPNFFLEIKITKYTRASPSGTKWRAFLEKELPKINPDEPVFKSSGSDSFPKWTLKDSGWEVVFTAIPKSLRARGKRGIRPVGITWLGPTWAKDHIHIRNSINTKATRYGDLGLPYVVAVNSLSNFGNDTAIQEALFGDEVVRVYRKSNGSYEHRNARKANGAWIGPKGPRNRGVSCAVILDSLLWGNIESVDPILWHNPWARNPLPSAYWLLSQKRVDLSNGRIDTSKGKRARDLFGLAEHWPAVSKKV
jgi:hypothetical protein